MISLCLLNYRYDSLSQIPTYDAKLQDSRLTSQQNWVWKSAFDFLFDPTILYAKIAAIMALSLGIFKSWNKKI